MKKISLMMALSWIVLTQPAQAQNDTQQKMMRINPMPPVSSLVAVPPEMRQRWILNGCEAGEVAFRFSRRYMMASVPQGSKLFRLGGLGDQGNGRYTMSTPAETTGLMMGSDGRLIQIFGDLNVSFSRAALEARQIMIPHIFYDNCTKAEAVRVTEDPVMLSLLPSLDDLQEACPAPGDISKRPCQDALFAVFDKDKDKALDEAEMKQGWELLVGQSSFGVCGPGVSAADSLRGDGDDYITWIFQNLDPDKNKKVTLDDFLLRWDSLQKDPLMSGLTTLMTAADGQTKILPEDEKVTCVNCCISPAP